MSTMAFGELSPEYVSLHYEMPFPYALTMLSRQGSGDIYTWTGGPSHADLEQSFRWMSVTKVLVSTAFWVQLLLQLSGQTLPLDTSVPFPASLGVTLRGLLAHCPGLPFDNPHPDGVQDFKNQLGMRLGITSPRAVTITPSMKRAYSNCGSEVVTSFTITKLATPWIRWVAQTILHPLGVSDTKLMGPPAWGVINPINDLAKLAAELLNSTRTPLNSSDITDFARLMHSGLRGMLPGYGYHRDSLWGTGIEIHGYKTPHYLSPESPFEVLGHFGQSSSFIWADLGVGMTGVFLGDRNFGSIHKSL